MVLNVHLLFTSSALSNAIKQSYRTPTRMWVPKLRTSNPDSN